MKKVLEHSKNLCSKEVKQLTGTRITVERAPEPSDVLWENLSYRTFEKFITRIITRFAALIAIGIGFGGIVLIYWGQV